MGSKLYISRKMIQHLHDNPGQAVGVNALMRLTGGTREQVYNGMASWIRNHDAKGERHGIEVVKPASSWRYNPSLNGQAPQPRRKAPAPSSPWELGQVFELVNVLGSGTLLLSSDDGRVLSVRDYDVIE